MVLDDMRSSRCGWLIYLILDSITHGASPIVELSHCFLSCRMISRGFGQFCWKTGNRCSPGSIYLPINSCSSLFLPVPLDLRLPLSSRMMSYCDWAFPSSTIYVHESSSITPAFPSPVTVFKSYFS